MILGKENCVNVKRLVDLLFKLHPDAEISIVDASRREWEILSVYDGSPSEPMSAAIDIQPKAE